MAFYESQPYQNYHSWGPSDMLDYEPCPQEFILKNQPMDNKGDSMQPIQRYLQEQDNSYLLPIQPEETMTMQSFPDMSLGYMSMDPTNLPFQMPSPTQSGISSHMSSNWSEADLTPYSSPDMCSVAYSPDTVYTEVGFHSFGTLPPQGDNNTIVGGHCVALHDVQTYADAQPEKLHFEEDNSYASFIHEGYQATQLNSSVQLNSSQETIDQPTHDQTPSDSQEQVVSPVIRRRRPQATRTATSPYLPSKVNKRSPPNKRSISYQDTTGIEDKTAPSAQRAFACPFATYGCASTFGSKNEWKRHCQTQHMRLGFWRCDLCPQTKPNDFNRKDLFSQHVRRMHISSSDTHSTTSTKSKSSANSKKVDSDEQELLAASQRCYLTLRSPPTLSSCLFCSETFSGPNSWDERMEHVGRHLEAKKKEGGAPADLSSWRLDEPTEAWLIKEKLIVKQKGRWVLADARV